MIAKLTNEQIAALRAGPPGEECVLVDEQSGKEYVLFDKAAYERWIERQIDEALEQVDRGEVEEWEIDSIKEEGLQRLDARRPINSEQRRMQ